jgi:arylsulfatase A-like enzyme
MSASAGHRSQAYVSSNYEPITDIAPTILEATGIPQPKMVNGIEQRPMDGVSMAYTWDKANANAPSQRTTQYFEMLGNRAIYGTVTLSKYKPLRDRSRLA